MTKTLRQKQRTELNGAIREVVELTHGEAVKHRVSIRTDLADVLPPVLGDRIELQQVMLNLIINAIDALSLVADRKRELLIRSWVDALGGVLVEVRDWGPGLDPKLADGLFEAFSTTKAEGMGMGLAICRSIIEAHGGRLWAGANEPQGAVFQFVLPAEPDDSVPAKEAEKETLVVSASEAGSHP